MPSKRSWRFFRAGGFDQVRLDSGEDLAAIDQLDQKLWVALACPTSGLEIDPRTLALIDGDKDGRVRASELIAAVKFATANLKSPDDLLKSRSTLPLAAINDAAPEGQTLLASARQILANIGKGDATEISADDVADPARIFAETAFNGDGVITEASGSDEGTRAVIREIIDCLGSVQDRSGKPGVDEERVTAFFAEIDAHAEWYARADADAARVLPLGFERTEAAAAAVDALRAKVDDYFGRCRLAGFDPRATAILNRKEEEYVDIAAGTLTLWAEEVADFPLAHVAAGRPLPLGPTVNPAHEQAVKVLADAAVTPFLGRRTELTESDWRILTERLAPFAAWRAEKQGAHVEKLGAARVREIRASAMREALLALIAKDRSLEAEATSIESVERLVRYHRDLYVLCTNFVNFKDFYDGEGDPATFQNGTLYLDRRACRLCMRVEDPAKHAIMAGLAGAYLAYLECVRKSSNEKMQIVAVFTAGDSGNLMAGRNGVFYDRQGKDWDATITKIIDSPISLRQAFWSPYRKFARLIEEQVAKRAGAAEAETHGHLNTVAATTVNADKAKPLEAKKIDVGAVAALGVAVGAIGTFITALVGYGTGLVKLGLLPTVLAVVGVMVLISLPSVILAYIKLRKRNLGPILDANGWAVNADAKISVPFGRTLTSVAKLPPGSRRDSSDRFADKGLPWKRLLFLFLVLYLGWRWYRGGLDRYLPEQVQSKTVLGDYAPEPESDPAAPPEAAPPGAPAPAPGAPAAAPAKK